MAPEPAAAAADEAKNQGNAFFKSGNVAEASKCYAKAEELCPDNPVYASNLSAALFEEGDYLSCVLAIDRWCKLHHESKKSTGTGSEPLKTDADPSVVQHKALSLRLSGRLAKALSHGVRSGSVSQKHIDDVGDTITELERVGASELQRLWSDWQHIARETGDRGERVAAARARFSVLPIFRKAAKPIMEFFNIGQDPLMSLVDDWGPDHETPLKLDSMSTKDISKISFLLGGVGDARHVYSTLVGLHRAHGKLDKERKESFRVHITLLDIHPAALARDLCILLLLDQLVDTPTDNSTMRAEILSTMFYTFAAAVMPEYCWSRLEKVMQDLKSSLTGDGAVLPSWIHVDSAAITQINSALDFWLSVPRRYTTERILQEHVLRSPADIIKNVNLPNISEEYRDGLKAKVADHRKDVLDAIKTMSSAQLRAAGLAGPGPNASAQEKKRADKRIREIIDSLVETSLNEDGNMKFERYWYERFKIFVPPRELWSKHVGMDLFPRMLEGPPSPNAFSQIEDHIEATWKPNSTLFDPAAHGPPDLNLNPFEAPGYIDLFNLRFGISSTSGNDAPDAPSFGNFADLFVEVAKAMKALKNQVKLELLCGELTQELTKMRFGGDHTRPADFPRLYSRAHLSNVPDYTHGTLNTILYALPIVDEVASNCYLNCGIWANDEEFIHTYTLLTSADVPKYLGCKFVSKDAISGLVILRKQTLPLPLHGLASRPELVTWLTRVLLYTVIPASSHEGQFRARLPNNLVAFVSLLIHLRGVGYPAHWIGEFLQTVLSGSLVTEIAPYAGKWPIPVSDMARRVPARAVRLDPWTAELETILALAHEAMPFYVPVPDDFALHHSDIATFEARVQESSYWMGAMMGTMVNPMPVVDPVVCLLFYRPLPGVAADDLVPMLPRILNGARTPAPGTLCVLTAQEVVAVPILRWRLSKARVARMVSEGWMMVAYRTDVQLIFTAPISANRWREV
ncbi:hypothetical protein B0H15DRAFT_139954 [Mycena belliarum]|uniref:DUF4470 domain-containing protein n=1 Tax=Mycena belliarum TaxID=1033014 RepID=A0AAD6TRK7_9AGAR|nr:hypothetical protein B0H15DRAFT_139954 [Mycena belliae]